MKTTKGMINASWTKSLGDARSQTRYHLVYGTAPVMAVREVLNGESALSTDVAAETVCSGVSKRSAKSGHEPKGIVSRC